MDLTWLWIPATLFAAAAQSGRNAVQRGLTASLGTLGATQVRFLYGFPFALIFLAIVLGVGGESLPAINTTFLAFAAGGAMAQILATALMLAAMRERSFVVVTAWTKTEPIQVAIFGFVLLGDPFSPWVALAIVIATAGVVLMSFKPGSGTPFAWRPVTLGIVSGAFFAASAIGFRGAILALDSGSFMIQATWTLVWALGIQVVVLLGWMLLCNRTLLINCLKAWRASIWGGLLGASASQGWFLGFALTAAANVRTLGLVEVLFAQILSRRLFAQDTSRRETWGIILIVAGVGLLLFATR